MPGNNWKAEIARLHERDRRARAILGVSGSSDAAEIRNAFRRASLAHHPDTNPQDDEAAARFRLICCAYRFLTEGEACGALDGPERATIPDAQGRYHLDNPWGYWCWWHDKYFGELQ